MFSGSGKVFSCSDSLFSCIGKVFSSSGKLSFHIANLFSCFGKMFFAYAVYFPGPTTCFPAIKSFTVGTLQMR